MNMKRLFSDLWWDIKNLYPKRSIFAVSCFLISIVAAISFYLCRMNLYDQQAAQRWSEQERYTQLSCFYPVQDVNDEYQFLSIHHQIVKELENAAIDYEGHGKSFVDAYSVLGEVTMKTSLGSVTVDTYGVSDDFFFIHPVQLSYGAYFDDTMLMDDGVILDEGTAWKLYGSSDVIGMSVEINGMNYYIRGVVKSQQGHFYEAAGLEKSCCFIPFSMFDKIAVKTGGYTYEAIMPEPVEGFAKEIFTRVIADTEGRLEIVENSLRFSFDSMKNVLLDFGIRSMSQKGIIFPYWENVARAVEDVCSVIWLIQVTTGVGAILFFIMFVYIEWKKHKPKVKDVMYFLSDKKDCFIDAIHNRRNKCNIEKNKGRNFKKKEKEGVKNEKKVD